MRTYDDPMFAAAVHAGLRACAVACPEPTDGDESRRRLSADRAERVQLCRALIADGLYETEDRLDAAITRLASRLDD